LQLKASMTHGYWYARQITYLMSGTFHSLEWLRIIGDLTFILAGALPIFIAVALAYIHRDVPAEEQVSPAD
jgi:nitric oxide reductase subunit B